MRKRRTAAPIIAAAVTTWAVVAILIGWLGSV